MAHTFPHSVRLDERRFATAEVVRLAGVSEKAIQNWLSPTRNTLQLGGKRYGRLTFSLLEVMQFAVMADLTQRVPLRPLDAVASAKRLADYVAEHAPRDAQGHPVADPSAIARSLAFGIVVLDGETHIGLIDPTQPGYTDFRSNWCRAHIVLPIASLVADVLFRLLELLDEQGAPR